MIKRFFKHIGPGPLVAAAFIGPGTVTVCTLAGVQFGYALLWAMVLSIVATIVLQEMAARLGVITNKGLAELIRSEIKSPLLRQFFVVLIIAAIVVGNAAYEAGNISGAVLGVEAIFGGSGMTIFDFNINLWSVFIGVIAFVLLYIGNYKFLEKALISLVILMSIAFLLTVIITQPNIKAILKGAFVPSLPNGSLLTVIGLIGTTVVPYNLFMHSSLVKEKWNKKSDLRYAQADTMIAIILGGIVSMSIIICAASIDLQDVANASDLAMALEPLFGINAKYLLGIGLFAAGITSAITAPLAAAFVACGCMGWSTELKSSRFRMVWIIILAIGVLSASSGFKSIDIIKFAQVSNGLLLPVIAGVLLWMMNSTAILGVYKNSKLQNVLGFGIVIITIFLGAKGIL
ncbi:MAG: Nramp family divalent metal transporter, partial [Winogradskyella sp.]|nr:Nramp family divalent metal transporter [Winogradskyella sp.]